MTRVTVELNKVLAENITTRGATPPEVSYEIITALADEHEKIGGKEREVGSMRRSAWALVPMFNKGGFWARDEWERQRKTHPWYKRIFISHTPTEEFYQEFTEANRARGRQIVADIRAGEQA